MKKILLAGASAILAVSAAPALAQDDSDMGDTPEVEEVEPVESGQPMEPTANGNGATVLRESGEITQQATDPETGELLFEEPAEGETEGAPIMETVGTAKTQTVTTPSGNVNTVTKTTDLHGNSVTTVDHVRAERPEKPAMPEKLERPEKPEKPERPEKPEKPDAPGRP